VVAAFAYIFNPSMIAFTWLLALVLKGSLQHILVGALQVVLVLLTTTLLKRLTGRHRPELYTPRQDLLHYNFRSKETNLSMPSGDSAQAAAFWTFVNTQLGLPLGLAVVMTGCTMYARVYFMCHFIGDTLVGAAIGSAISLSVNHFLGVYD
jgi:membrane-associated phospholipid phosphatase